LPHGGEHFLGGGVLFARAETGISLKTGLRNSVPAERRITPWALKRSEGSVFELRRADLRRRRTVAGGAGRICHRSGTLGTRARPDRCPYGEFSARNISALAIAIPADGAGLPLGSGDYVRGKTVYETQCAACHGADLMGVAGLPNMTAGGRGHAAALVGCFASTSPRSNSLPKRACRSR